MEPDLLKSTNSNQPLSLQAVVLIDFLIQIRRSALMEVDAVESCLIELGRPIERTSELRRRLQEALDNAP